jgi:RNA polymerase sigma-70 factor (ECF subfamily)
MTVREPEPQCVPAPPPGATDASADASAHRPEASAGAENAEARLRGIVDRHYDSLWRTLRYLGVPEALTDDAAQKVLCVLARRLNDVEKGAEMSFLFSTAVRVASETRRAARRDRTQPVEDIDVFLASGPNPEDLVDQRRAHEVLSEVLAGIPIDERMTFILYEIEELTLAEIAEILAVPAGTIASRLRRARKAVQDIVRRRSARLGGRS